MTRSLIQNRDNQMIPRREDLISPFEQVFDKFFEDFFHSNPLSRVKASQGFPRMNVSEKDGRFMVALSVPGMTTEDVTVEVDSNNILSVRGKMSSEHQSPEGATYYLRELRQSAFERSVQLPDHVVGDPEAVMKDGILKLSWETQEKKPEGIRTISVKNE